MLTTLWVPYQQASLLLPPWHDSSCKTVVWELNKDPNFHSWKRHGILLSGGSKYVQLRILSWQGVSVLDSRKFLECDNPWNARRWMILRTEILDRWSTLIDGTPKALVSTSPASSPLPTAHLQTHAPPHTPQRLASTQTPPDIPWPNVSNDQTNRSESIRCGPGLCTNAGREEHWKVTFYTFAMDMLGGMSED